MDYVAALRFLSQLGNEISTAKFGLDAIRRLCEALGHPEQSFSAVLIAGTNGKGSTAATLYSILLQAGISTGSFTSPHLVHPRERIRMGHGWISEADFAARISHVEETAGQLLRGGELTCHPTYFEMLTAVMYIHFAEAGVRLAVLEVGMGGRLDATNISAAVLTLITSLSLDHQQYLGSTLPEIAFEKAGILRSGVPCLLAETAPEAEAVVRECAASCGAPLVHLREHARIVSVGQAQGRYRFELETARRRYLDLESALSGPHQPGNTALAILAAETLEKYGYPIGEEQIRAGVRTTFWPGRLQVVREAPHVILDGAHNPEAASSLARYLAESFPGGDLIIVFGAMGDKAFETLGAILFPYARKIVLTRGRNSRFAEPAEMASVFQPGFGTKLVTTAGVREALEVATAAAHHESWILVTGSLYLVGETMECLGVDPLH